MKGFFLMTRGRTGSTAVIDELNKTKSVAAAQELFLEYDFTKKQELLSQLYKLVPPFQIWQEGDIWWRRWHKKLLTKRALIKSYLRDAEAAVSDEGKVVLGFKALSHHLDEMPFLKEVLLEREYRAVYLTRNIPRQVVSGMVAKLRGKYNAHADENYEDNARYRIDVDEFESLVKWEAQAVKNDLAMLESAGFNFIVVSYEEFMANRQAFFDRVLEFVGLPSEVPQASSYSVMIRDTGHTVENYQAVADRVAAMGLHIE